MTNSMPHINTKMNLPLEFRQSSIKNSFIHLEVRLHFSCNYVSSHEVYIVLFCLTRHLCFKNKTFLLSCVCCCMFTINDSRRFQAVLLLSMFSLNDIRRFQAVFLLSLCSHQMISECFKLCYCSLYFHIQ